MDRQGKSNDPEATSSGIAGPATPAKKSTVLEGVDLTTTILDRRHFLKATAGFGVLAVSGGILAACAAPAPATPAPATPAPGTPAAPTPTIPGPEPTPATGRYGGPAPRRIGGTVTVVGGGQTAPGPVFDLRNKYIWEVLREDWGVDVQIQELDYALLETKIRTNQVDFDIVDADGWWAARAAMEGWLEPVDYGIIDATQLIDGAAREFSVLNGFGGHHIAWNTNERYGPDQGPRNWVEFFDEEMFPGRLAFRDAAFRTLPAAAMGAGIAPEDLYPLDLDAAFDTLERVKHRVVAWNAGAQPHQDLALAGEADLFNLYTSRCVVLQRDGEPIDFRWTQGTKEDADMVAIRDTPNREQALAYMSLYFNTPEFHKEFSEAVLIGFSNRLGMEMVEPELRAQLSSAPGIAEQFAPAGNEWWAEHSAEAEQRMSDFILG